MQAKMVCFHCGAESFAEARFCRQCGQRLDDRPPVSVTEGSTRLFDAPYTPPKSDPFANENQWAGGPIVSHDANFTSSVAGKHTQTLGQPKSYKGLFLIGGSAFLAFAVLALILLFRFWGTVTINPPSDSAPPPPSALQEPPAPSASGTNVFSKLMYPGAKTTMSVSGGGEGNVLQLETTDTVEKVANWYRAKFSNPKVTSIPKSQIIDAGNIKVIIIDQNNGTRILLTQGQD
jgi:hypothetical protein